MVSDEKVAVYVDFDNVVISRYDELHGKQAFRDDRAGGRNVTQVVRRRLFEAHLDIGALMDYAASVGPVAISRAYANWSNGVCASYSLDMMRHSVDLVQLFPLTGTKNGADIRLAIDVIDDLARYPHVANVIIVAGDSDYVALAQRCRRLGRRVIGVGVLGSVSRYWEAACDEFRYYGSILQAAENHPEPTLMPPALEATQDDASGPDSAALLLRAARLLHSNKAVEWIHAAGLKSLMRRLEPAFDETAEGFKSFTDFLNNHVTIVATKRTDSGTLVRLHERGSVDGAAHSPTLDRKSERPEAERLRRHLHLGAGVTVSADLESLAIQAVKKAWLLCDPASGAHYEATPTMDLRHLLVQDGASEEDAKYVSQIALSFYPVLLRDSSMRLRPNQELADCDDNELRALIRSGLAERIRSREDGASASANSLIEAIYGTQGAPDAFQDYQGICSRMSVRQLSEVLRPVLVPAPVLWDVAAAFVAIPIEADLSSIDRLRIELESPLMEMERDLDTVPLQAVFESLIDGRAISHEDDGVLRSTMTGAKTEDVVAAVILAWKRRCNDDSFNLEAFYQLVLPDRFQLEWRRWVREIISLHI